MSLAGAVPTKPVARTSAWRRTGDVLGTAVAVLFVMVAAAVVVIAAATRLSTRQQYTAFGHPVLVVLSGSMSPGIRTGDLIVDDPVGAAAATRLHRGQVITFYDQPGSKTVITHRIVRVVHQNGQVLYQTKGDANDAPDATLRQASTVIGTYAWKVPRGGYFLTNLHRPIVFGLLLLAPILWLVAEPLRRWAREEDELEAPSDTGGDREDGTA
jgi:signal peptidase